MPAQGRGAVLVLSLPLPFEKVSRRRPSFLAPAGQQRNHADDELVVAQMREQLLARMRSLGNLQPPAEAAACLEVGVTCAALPRLGMGGWLGCSSGYSRGRGVKTVALGAQHAEQTRRCISRLAWC